VTPLIVVASLQSPYFIERDEDARRYSPQLSLATRQELGSNFGSKLTRLARLHPSSDAGGGSPPPGTALMSVSVWRALRLADVLEMLKEDRTLKINSAVDADRMER